MATNSSIPVYPAPRTGGAPPSRTLPRNGARRALQPAPMPPIMTWPPERRCGRRLP